MSASEGRAVYHIVMEQAAQHTKWGEAGHPDGTGLPGDREMCDYVRTMTAAKFDRGIGTWRDILDEKVTEAFAESDPVKLRRELIQVGAVAASWIEAIDRRLVGAGHE